MYGLSEMVIWVMVIAMMVMPERIWGGHGSVDDSKARNRQGHRDSVCVSCLAGLADCRVGMIRRSSGGGLPGAGEVKVWVGMF